MFTLSHPPGDQTRNNTVAIVSTVSTATTPEAETSTTPLHTTKTHLNSKPNLNIKPNLNSKKNRKPGKYNHNSLKYERQTKSATVSSDNPYTSYCSVYDLSQPIEAEYQCVNSRIAGMSPAKVSSIRKFSLALNCGGFLSRNCLFGRINSLPVVDPGFSPVGCANSQNCYYFSHFCRKMRENERIWTPRGRVPGAPPWIRQCLQC